jgi:hypothetical protein
VTGRAGVAVVFAACFAGLLLADLAHWAQLADAVFFLSATLTAYYVRRGGLLPVVVSPPLLFFAACLASRAVAGAVGLVSTGATGDTLAAAVGWLVAGTAVAVTIGLLRGLRAELRELLGTRR